MYIKMIVLAVCMALSAGGSWWVCDSLWTTKVTTQENQMLKDEKAETLRLRAKVLEISELLKQERENAKDKLDNVYRDIDIGDLRLSVPVAACATDTTGDPGTPDSETRCELGRQVAKDIIAIAAEGDDAIRDLEELTLICQEMQKSCFEKK